MGIDASRELEGKHDHDLGMEMIPIFQIKVKKSDLGFFYKSVYICVDLLGTRDEMPID